MTQFEIFPETRKLHQQDVDVLRESFEAVQNPENWKFPIRRQRIPLDRLELTACAIEFFCASPTNWEPASDGFHVWIEAPGYYASIGA